MTLQRTRARKALTNAGKGKGRPRTPEQRLVAMMVSVEAYVGAGLPRQEAMDRASDKWGNSAGRLEDIYLKETKLSHDGGSELLRAFFHKIKVEEVDRFIKDFPGLKNSIRIITISFCFRFNYQSRPLH